MCRTCHGLDGLAVMPVAPNIGGESAGYIAAQLEAFRSGVREHEMMSVVAAGLSDGQIADVAAWYAAQAATAVLPAGLRSGRSSRGLRRLPRRRRHRGDPGGAQPRRREHDLHSTPS